MGPTPASTAASEMITLTGVPVSARSDPACAPKASGIINCDGCHRSRIAITTTTGTRAATDALTVMSAVSSATSNSMSTSTRVRLSPAFASSCCPAHAVTPLASRASATTKSDAMNRIVGSPKPANACPRVRMSVAHRVIAAPSATIATGMPVPDEDDDDRGQHEEGDGDVIHGLLRAIGLGSVHGACRDCTSVIV